MSEFMSGLEDQDLSNMDPDELAALEEAQFAAARKRAEVFPTEDAEIEDFLNSMPLLSTAPPRTDKYKTMEQEIIDHMVDETPLVERANVYKESGNEAFMMARKDRKEVHRFQDAILYYSQGLDVKCGDRSTEAALYANRAFVHLLQENYGKCIQDCMQSIRLISTNIKAYHRAAQAANALKKHKQALQFIEGGLAACKKHMLSQEEVKAFKTLEVVVKKAQKVEEAELQARAKDKAAADAGTTKQVKTIKHAIKDRKILVGDPLMDMSGFEGYQAEPTVDSSGNLHWPVLLLYEESFQTDFVRDFPENSTFREQLVEMFPPKGAYPPWDTKQEYNLSNLSLFHEFKGADKRVEVNLDDTLASVLNHQKPKATVPGVPTFFVNLKVKEA
jgi:tetratricopeptide (TPR) repeat protein